MQVKNKIMPKIKPPLLIVKRNLDGKIITNSVELKSLYLNHFLHRMRKRPILKQYEQYSRDIENDFSRTLELTKNVNFPDWSLKDLEFVLKSLKRSQSLDKMGLINELFMLENIGEDLKISLLQLFNRIKNSQIIPDFFQDVYITSIPKRKKAPLDLESQ